MTLLEIGGIRSPRMNFIGGESAQRYDAATTSSSKCPGQRQVSNQASYPAWHQCNRLTKSISKGTINRFDHFALLPIGNVDPHNWGQV